MDNLNAESKADNDNLLIELAKLRVDYDELQSNLNEKESELSTVRKTIIGQTKKLSEENALLINQLNIVKLENSNLTISLNTSMSELAEVRKNLNDRSKDSD